MGPKQSTPPPPPLFPPPPPPPPFPPPPSPQPLAQINSTIPTEIKTTKAKSAPDLPKGPSNFSSFQIPGVDSNSLNINLANLQQCLSETLDQTSLNNCISTNINGYDNKAGSYQNINYVGPGHSLDTNNNVIFGPFDSTIQNFENINKVNVTKNQLIFYIVIVIIYLIIMLK
jgi:hypothetical protein